MSQIQQPYVPRRVPLLRGEFIAHDWDSWLQDVVSALDALNVSILSGPDADPNGVVIGSPGYLYRRIGAATSALYVKESGVQTNTGWILK